MFESIQHCQDKEGQSHAIIDCYDVRYCVYFNCDAEHVEINTYIVHLNRGGLIRRDYCPTFVCLNFGGPFVVLY